MRWRLVGALHRRYRERHGRDFERKGVPGMRLNKALPFEDRRETIEELVKSPCWS
jgi:hypothetical protein